MRPGAVTLIAAVNGLAVLLHLAFWSLAAATLPTPWSFDDPTARAAMAFTYGFGLADLIWSVPFLLAGSVGLFRLRPWGWVGAQAANVLYWYSSTVILVRDATARSLSPGTVIFLPFALFAIWAAIYLWSHRRFFFDAGRE
jgi:hypothetical protein